jgi:hypothetical protein
MASSGSLEAKDETSRETKPGPSGFLNMRSGGAQKTRSCLLTSCTENPGGVSDAFDF